MKSKKKMGLFDALPFDVVCFVFSRCLDPTWLPREKLRLRLVCKKWKRAADSAPVLGAWERTHADLLVRKAKMGFSLPRLEVEDELFLFRQFGFWSLDYGDSHKALLVGACEVISCGVLLALQHAVANPVQNVAAWNASSERKYLAPKPETYNATSQVLAGMRRASVLLDPGDDSYLLPESDEDDSDYDPDASEEEEEEEDGDEEALSDGEKYEYDHQGPPLPGEASSALDEVTLFLKSVTTRGESPVEVVACSVTGRTELHDLLNRFYPRECVRDVVSCVHWLKNQRQASFETVDYRGFSALDLAIMSNCAAFSKPEHPLILELLAMGGKLHHPMIVSLFGGRLQQLGEVFAHNFFPSKKSLHVKNLNSPLSSEETFVAVNYLANILIERARRGMVSNSVQQKQSLPSTTIRRRRDYCFSWRCVNGASAVPVRVRRDSILK